jgi:hypothetical protein
MSRFMIEMTRDGRLRTCGLVEAGLHELSMRDPGVERRDAARDLLLRIGAYQISEDDPFEADDEIVDGFQRFRTRRNAVDGTLELVLETSH